MEKEFHLGDILTVTTERMVALNGMGAVGDILNFLTSDNLRRQQFPRACAVCKPYLLEQHPDLREIDVSACNSKTWRSWLGEQIAKFGEKRTIEPLTEGLWQHEDSIDEGVRIL